MNDLVLQRERMVRVHNVTEGWFTTYGTPIRAGRDVDAHDTAEAAPVAVAGMGMAANFIARLALHVSPVAGADEIARLFADVRFGGHQKNTSQVRVISRFAVRVISGKVTRL